jgi:hypothetical protein
MMIYDLSYSKMMLILINLFINTKSNKILIFENNPVKDHHQYVFDESSLIHEIE